MAEHELKKLIAAADAAINREDFDALMEFYAEDATLVIMPGRTATGKEQIRSAMVRIAEYFNHSVQVSQGEMIVLEGGETARVLADILPDGQHRTLEGQEHNVDPAVLAPVLVNFFKIQNGTL